jgi:hypothetical protein
MTSQGGTITSSPIGSFLELPSIRGSISRHSATPGRLGGSLRSTWAAVGERHHEPDRLPDDGLNGELVEIAGQPVVLVTFPMALHAGEAFFAVIAPISPHESRRYLTLEFSWNVVTDHPATVIGEWRADGRHLNLGAGPDAARSAFLAKAQELLSS